MPENQPINRNALEKERAELLAQLQGSLNPRDFVQAVKLRRFLILGQFLKMSEDQILELAASTRDLSPASVREMLLPTGRYEMVKFIRSRDRVVMAPYSPELHNERMHLHYSIAAFGLEVPEDAGFMNIHRSAADILQVHGDSSSLAIIEENPDRPTTISIARAALVSAGYLVGGAPKMGF